MRYMDLPSYMADVYGASEHNYEEMIREMARYYARQELILQAIADERELNPSEEEVKKVISEYVASDSSVEKEEDVRRLIRESLRDDLMTKNVLDWLYDHCEVEEPSEDESPEADTALTSSTAQTAEEAASGETAEAASTSEAADEDASDKDAVESASTEETAAEGAAESASTGVTADMAALHDN